MLGDKDSEDNMGTKTKQGHIFIWNKDKTLGLCKNCNLKTRIIKALNPRGIKKNSYIPLQQYWHNEDWIQKPIYCNLINRNKHVGYLYLDIMIKSGIYLLQNKCPIHGLKGQQFNTEGNKVFKTQKYGCANKDCYLYWDNETINKTKKNLQKCFKLLLNHFNTQPEV